MENPQRLPSKQWFNAFGEALDFQDEPALKALALKYSQEKFLNWDIGAINYGRPSALDCAIWYRSGWAVSVLLEQGEKVTCNSVRYAFSMLYLKRDSREQLEKILESIWHPLSPSILAESELCDAAVACFFDHAWDSCAFPIDEIWDAMGLAGVKGSQLDRCVNSFFYQAPLSPLQLAWLAGWPDAMLLLMRQGASPGWECSTSALPAWSLLQVIEQIETAVVGAWSEKDRRWFAAMKWPSVNANLRTQVSQAFEWSFANPPLWAAVRACARGAEIGDALPPVERAFVAPRMRF